MRKAFCTGCNTVFDRMHAMINHRRTHRCGGRFLSQEAQEYLADIRLHGFSFKDINEDETEYAFIKIDVPRKRRHKARIPGSRKPVQRFNEREHLWYLGKEITHQRPS